MQQLPNQVLCHLNDILYRAVYEIAKKNPVIEWKVNQLDGEDPKDWRERFFGRLNEIINTYRKPIIVSNITLYVVIETLYKKNEEIDYKNDSYYYADNKVFEIYYDALLSGHHNNFVIFEEDSFDNAAIVTYDVENFL